MLKSLVFWSFAASVVAALLLETYVILALVPAVLLMFILLSDPKRLFFLLLFTIPLSTEFQVNAALGTDLPDEPLMWLLTAALVILLIRSRSLPKWSQKDPILHIILLSLLWTLITVIASQQKLISLKYLAAKAWYIVPFVIGTTLLLKTGKDREEAAKTILLPMILAVVVILFRHALYGFSFDTVNAVTVPFFRNHVNYGAFLVCMVPLVWAMYRQHRKYWMMVLLLFLTGLVFSYSRGAWLALAVSMLVVYLVKRRKLQWLIATAGVLVMTASFWLLQNNRYLQFRPQYEKTIYHGSFDQHMEATYRMQDMSTVERFYRWIAATRMVKEHWFMGSGPNSFFPLYKSYAVNDFRTYVSDNPERSTVHNYFLLLLTEQGSPGMLLFIILFVMMLLRAQTVYHQSRSPEIRGLMLVVSAILGMIGVLIFLSDLIETDKIGSLFYLCAGLLISTSDPAIAASRQAHPEAHSPIN